MNTLTTMGNTQMTMTSLALLDVINGHRLEDGKGEMRHDNFMSKIEDELEGAALNFQEGYLDVNNQERKCYNLPKEECMLMAMRESKYVRKQTVAHIKALETQLALPDFTNPAIAAKAWATEYEAKEALQLELKVKEEQQLIDAPKVEFHDKVSDVTTVSTLGSVAKVFGIGRNTMMSHLRSVGILQKDNQPYQRFINSKHFTVKEKVGANYISYTTYVTGKGQTYLYKRLMEDGLIKQA